MADSLYFSLWFSDFGTENMFMHALAVIREFPFSQRLPGITGLALHPVSWNEATILEERFAPGAQPEEAIAIASGLVHEDYAYVFEANWDVWTPRQAPAEWILEPSPVQFIVLNCVGSLLLFVGLMMARRRGFPHLLMIILGTIFLVNGVKLQGVVTWFDNFCVLLRRDGHSQLVYKHAISTIMPGHPIQLFEGAEEPAPVQEKV